MYDTIFDKYCIFSRFSDRLGDEADTEIEFNPINICCMHFCFEIVPFLLFLAYYTSNISQSLYLTAFSDD